MRTRKSILDFINECFISPTSVEPEDALMSDADKLERKIDPNDEDPIEAIPEIEDRTSKVISELRDIAPSKTNGGQDPLDSGFSMKAGSRYYSGQSMSEDEPLIGTNYNPKPGDHADWVKEKQGFDF